MILSLLLDELHHLKKTNKVSIRTVCLVWTFVPRDVEICESPDQNGWRTGWVTSRCRRWVRGRTASSPPCSSPCPWCLKAGGQTEKTNRRWRWRGAKSLSGSVWVTKTREGLFAFAVMCNQILNALLQIQHRTSFKLSLVWMSSVQQTDGSLPMFAGKGTSWTAGSRLMTYGGALRECRWAVSLCRKQKSNQITRDCGSLHNRQTNRKHCSYGGNVLRKRREAFSKLFY